MSHTPRVRTDEEGRGPGFQCRGDQLHGRGTRCAASLHGRPQPWNLLLSLVPVAPPVPGRRAAALVLRGALSVSLAELRLQSSSTSPGRWTGPFSSSLNNRPPSGRTGVYAAAAGGRAPGVAGWEASRRSPRFCIASGPPVSCPGARRAATVRFRCPDSSPSQDSVSCVPSHGFEMPLPRPCSQFPSDFGAVSGLRASSPAGTACVRTRATCCRAPVTC